MILAPSSSETLNYVVWLVRSSLQQEGGGTLSYGRVVSYSCQVGESPLWITRQRAAVTTLFGEEKFSFLNVISPFFLPHRIVLFISVPLKNEAHKIALIWQI